jgi:uncharacterized protein (TIGR03435 family)
MLRYRYDAEVSASHRMSCLATFIAIIAVATTAAFAQNPESRSPFAFDVASVKPNNLAEQAPSRISGPTPGRFTITNVPLRFILLHAFGLLDHQLIGAPAWTLSETFDITGTYPQALMPTDDNTRVMLQTLLADRFRLTMHRETRELPMYALVLVRKDGALGPQLTRSTVDCEAWIAEKRPQAGAGGPSKIAPGGARPACMMLASRRFLTAGTQTMARLSTTLQSLVARPVVDRTGLTGTFDIDLQWTSGVAGPPPGGNAASPDDGPSIFTALQEQLGLRLDSTRGPFDVVVIDAIQRPTPD